MIANIIDGILCVLCFIGWVTDKEWLCIPAGGLAMIMTLMMLIGESPMLPYIIPGGVS
jgi:hypothetical protein